MISAYPEEVTGAVDVHGDAVAKDSSITMCDYFFEFTSEVGLMQQEGGSRFNPREAQELGPDDIVSPMLHAFWGAGMSFSRGHFLLRVPYDPHTPMLFTGEEILVTVKVRLAWIARAVCTPICPTRPCCLRQKGGTGSTASKFLS